MSELLHPLPSEQNLRMTSMQIAELCGKEHKHVLRDIDETLTQLLDPDLGSVTIEQKTLTN